MANFRERDERETRDERRERRERRETRERREGAEVNSYLARWRGGRGAARVAQFIDITLKCSGNTRIYMVS